MEDAILHRYIADQFLLGLTIFREAAGEPYLGKLAVGWVARNRAESPGWWGESLYEVLTRREQFSSISHLGDPMTVRWPRLDDGVFLSCLQAAQDVMNSRAPDPTGGCDHYCTAAVQSKTSWAKDRKPDYAVGNHLFFKLGRDPQALPLAAQESA